MAAPAPIVFKLISCDDQVFEITHEAVQASKFLKDLTSEILDIPNMSPIPIRHVKASHLKLAIEWLEHHKGHQNQPLPPEIPQWDEQFLAVLEPTDVFELMIVSCQFDLNWLLSMTCQKIGYWMEGRTTEELQATFERNDD